jgi:hypothetical protein
MPYPCLEYHYPHDRLRLKFTAGGAKNYFIKMDALGVIQVIINLQPVVG